MAVQTSLRATDLPDSLARLRASIERAVPHGFVTIRGRSVKGAWSVTPDSVISRWRGLAGRLERIVEKYPRLAAKNPQDQLGTLGGGNHFIEICLDTTDTVWVMLHSGSRGIGNLIGQMFIELAREDMARAHSYIVRGLGNPESFESCSHGAGRRMSRGEARKRFTVADHRQATAGVECRKDADVLDETPAAYKDIEAVMQAQRDLVEIVHTLKQIVCVKG